jgi:hypothetical protein
MVSTKQFGLEVLPSAFQLSKSILIGQTGLSGIRFGSHRTDYCSADSRNNFPLALYKVSMPSATIKAIFTGRADKPISNPAEVALRCCQSRFVILVRFITVLSCDCAGIWLRYTKIISQCPFTRQNCGVLGVVLAKAGRKSGKHL